MEHCFDAVPGNACRSSSSTSLEILVPSRNGSRCFMEHLKVAEVAGSIRTIFHLIDIYIYIVASNVNMLHIMSSKCFIN